MTYANAPRIYLVAVVCIAADFWRHKRWRSLGCCPQRFAVELGALPEVGDFDVVGIYQNVFLFDVGNLR